MTKWTRATLPTMCGSCGHVIGLGAALFLIELENVKAGRRIKARCETCAGPAPPDLPLLVVERAPGPPFAMARFAPDMLPLDYKKLQTREPGEEG